MTITRDELTGAVVRALRSEPWAHAAWEGGSAAFGRVDEFSDVDLQVDVDRDRVDETFTIVEHALASLSPIELRWRLPEPTWHGHAQAFYRLRDTGEYLLLDLVVMKHGEGPRLREVERHGEAIVHFDKHGQLAESDHVDERALRAKLRERAEQLRTTFELFGCFTKKCLERGDALEALAFYQSQTLRPLVEVLRMRWSPARHDFGLRLIQHDVPPAVLGELEALHFVENAEELKVKHAHAEELFRRALADLDLGD